ncbi:hypothetical protein CEXT_747941 [Caerostris extrusa]|uniref:Uncharacterized protein n=1 Tax=Caerostris extrusa TaxID=172846 RepID=A0AAV4T4Q4_CAEEX|nr:hypothetical protein CEXT_747941 [Caerostris extrusa]
MSQQIVLSIPNNSRTEQKSFSGTVCYTREEVGLSLLFFTPLQKERAGAKVFGTVPRNGGGGCPPSPPYPGGVRRLVSWSERCDRPRVKCLVSKPLTACVDKPGRGGWEVFVFVRDGNRLHGER